jgi:site-specific recombinase XerD
MWAAHVLYMQERSASNPQHPWYLVNLAHNTGQPLTRSNARDLLKNACERLHLPEPHNLHALRHMYGDVTANLLKLALQEVQVGLRQSSILSTMIYSEPAPSTVRASIRGAKEK